MSKQISLVSFKINDELYSVNIMEVREVIRLTDVTPIPNSPDFVDGVINLRGEIIPIVDLCKRFHFTKKTFNEDEELQRGIIIVKVEGLIIGVMIDQVYRVLTINEDQIQPPPQMISGIGTEFIHGVAKLEEENLLVILDVKKLFSRQELLQLTGEM